jgi:death-on-curing protein
MDEIEVAKFKARIIRAHSDLIEDSGGAHGVRDDTLLDSALNAPFQTFGGYYLIDSELERGARLCFGIIKNHPFIDGNKRIGVHAMLIYFRYVNVSICYTLKDLEKVGLGVADGSNTYEDLIACVQEVSYLGVK